MGDRFGQVFMEGLDNSGILILEYGIQNANYLIPILGCGHYIFGFLIDSIIKSKSLSENAPLALL